MAFNQPQNTAFVVRVLTETPDEETLRSRFLASGVTFEVRHIADSDSAELGQAWYKDLDREFGVEWVGAE